MGKIVIYSNTPATGPPTGGSVPIGRGARIVPNPQRLDLSDALRVGTTRAPAIGSNFKLDATQPVCGFVYGVEFFPKEADWCLMRFASRADAGRQLGQQLRIQGVEVDLVLRSEERRVRKECRSRWSPY